MRSEAVAELRAALEALVAAAAESSADLAWGLVVGLVMTFARCARYKNCATPVGFQSPRGVVGFSRIGCLENGTYPHPLCFL